MKKIESGNSKNKVQNLSLNSIYFNFFYMESISILENSIQIQLLETNWSLFISTVISNLPQKKLPSLYTKEMSIRYV